MERPCVINSMWDGTFSLKYNCSALLNAAHTYFYMQGTGVWCCQHTRISEGNRRDTEIVQNIGPKWAGFAHTKTFFCTNCLVYRYYLSDRKYVGALTVRYMYINRHVHHTVW